MITRLKAEVLQNDNIAMKSSLELNNQQVAAMISETAIYKENAQKYMEEFNRVSQEYYEFR